MDSNSNVYFVNSLKFPTNCKPATSTQTYLGLRTYLMRIYVHMSYLVYMHRHVTVARYPKLIWENFCGFSLNRKSFPANYSLVDQQYESTELLQWKFYYK